MGLFDIDIDIDSDSDSEANRWSDCVESAEDASVCGPYPYDVNPDAASAVDRRAFTR
jgi:hypothetical protein